jgi:hypothetical protein
LNSVPVPPVQIDPRLPAALNEIILMAIARDPAQRFQSADAFRAALGSVGHGGMPAGASAIPSIGEPTKVMAASAGAAQPAAQVQKSGSRRGMYMALGSIATVGVLVLAAIQGPKLFKSSSAAQSQAVVTPVPQAQPQTTPAVQPTTPQVDTRPVDTAPAVSVPTQPTIVKPAPDPKTRLVAQQSAPTGMRAPQQTPQQQQTISQVQQPQQQPPQQQQQAAAPAVDNAKIAALHDLRDHLMILGTRANAVKGALATMKREQARDGLGMRTDIVAREQQMELHLDDAEASLKAGDPVKAKKSLDLAERDVEAVEKFLGR